MDFSDIDNIVGFLIDEENRNVGMRKSLSNPYVEWTAPIAPARAPACISRTPETAAQY